MNIKTTTTHRAFAIILACVLALSFTGLADAFGSIGIAEATDGTAFAETSEAPASDELGESPVDDNQNGEDGEGSAVPEDGIEQPETPDGADVPASESGADSAADGGDPLDSLDGGSAVLLSAEEKADGSEAALLPADVPEVSTIAELKSAISAAADGETITLAGDITVDGQVSLGSSPAKRIVIDGAGHSLFRGAAYSGYLFRIDGGNGIEFTDVTLDGLSLSNAYAFVYLTNGTLTLGSGTTMQNSRSRGSGGAVNAIGGTVTVGSGAILRNNQAANSGGAINIAGGSLTLKSGSTVQGNIAGGDGGGVNVYNTSGLTPVSFAMESGASVSGNQAVNGGGVVARLVAASDAVSVAGTITGNTATNHGGGLYVNPRAAGTQPVSLSGVALSGNRAAGAGGGLYLASSNPVDSLSLSAMTITDNSAKTGGGAFVYHRDNPTLLTMSIASSTITGNAAETHGGGVYVSAEGGLDATVSATTLSSNRSGTQGGGLWVIGRAGGGSRLAVANGSSISANESANGAGVYYRAMTSASSFELSGESSVSGNVAETSGGGLSLLADDAPMQVRIDDAKVSSNSQTDSGSAGGAGLYLSRVELLLGQDALVSSNQATMRGGGMLAARSTVAMEDGSKVIGNTAGHNGGGFFIQNSSSLVAENGSTIADNQAANGGGVFASGVSVDIAGSVAGNQASSKGGGVHVTNEGELAVREGALVAGNTALDSGGGIALTAYSSGNVAGSVTGNRAVRNGGGIFYGWPWNYVPSSTPSSVLLQLEDSASVSGNTAADGGGLYATGTENGGATEVRALVDGAAIAGNDASGKGGGVYVATATLDFNAGAISSNSSGDGLGLDMWVDPALSAADGSDGGVANISVDEGSFTDSADRDAVLIGAGTSGTINFLRDFTMKNHLLLQSSGVDRSTATVASGATLTLSGMLTVGVADGTASHALTVDPRGGSVLYKSDQEASGVDPLTGAVVGDLYAFPGSSSTVYLQWPESAPDRAADPFKGWNDDGTMLPNRGVGSVAVTGDTTVSAVWGTFAIRYFDEDGTALLSGLEPSAYAYGSGTTTLPQPTKDGYTFTAWYESADRSGSPVTEFANADQEDKTYYAAWSESPRTPTPSPEPSPGSGADLDSASGSGASSGQDGFPSRSSAGAAGMVATGDPLGWVISLGAVVLVVAVIACFVRRRSR